MNFNNNQYQQRLQQQQQGQMDWKLQYPESSRVDNVLKLFQTVFNSMSEVARNQPGIQNNLRAKAREYEQSQFNSCVTRELYLLKINEQLQKILNSKQQIGQMGQGQPVNLGATQAQQQINTNIGKQTNIGLNIQQPIANNTRQQQAATAALLNNGNLGFTPEQQKQYMQLQQMSQFNSQLMNQMLQQQQQQPIIQPNPLQQQQTFSKPVQNNNFANPNPFQFQNAAAKKLPPKSPIVTPNLAAPLRPLPTPSLAQVMQKYPSRDPKIVNELLIMEANTNIPTQILEISDSAKKEIIEVLNGLKIHFREIDQIIYDMKTILNNEAGFPVEKMMIIKKLLDLQYETLAVSQQPVFIIDINFCRQAVVQIVKLKKQIEAKRPIVIPDVVVAPKPQTKVQTPPKVVVDQTEKIAAKTLEILQRDYSEPEPKILTAKYCCTLGKPNLLENNERQRDLDGQELAELLYGPCEIVPISMLLPRQDTKQEPALNFENTLQSKLTMLSNKYSTSFTIEKISNLFYSILIHNSGSSLHLTAKDDNAYSVEDTNGIDAIIVSKAQEAAKNGAPIESLVSLVFKGKR